MFFGVKQSSNKQIKTASKLSFHFPKKEICPIFVLRNIIPEQVMLPLSEGVGSAETECAI